MANIPTDTRVCQIVTQSGLKTGNIFYYHLSLKNQISQYWFRLPPDMSIVSGTIRIHEEFNFFLGRFNNRNRPNIERVEGEDNTYNVSNFSGSLTDAIFDVKAGSLLRINLSQFGLPHLLFAEFTL